MDTPEMNTDTNTNNDDQIRLLGQAVDSLVDIFDLDLIGPFGGELHSLLSGALDNLYAAQRLLGVI